MIDVLKTNYYNQKCGFSEKIQAHNNKELHRAFSVFIHDGNGNMLIQKRAKNKYHSGGLWTNACCSHPISDDVKTEAIIRMKEELGFSCDIDFIDEFVYYTEFENGITEFELDYVFLGKYEQKDNDCYDRTEIEELKWINIDQLIEEVCERPFDYTRWFITALYMVIKFLKKK